MSEIKRNQNIEPEAATETKQHISTAMTLDDEQRIKVLSPSMLVFRRFIRNRLAIVGVLFIAAMFAFSFIGGWIMPYGESETFKKYVDMSKLYAGVTQNQEYQFVIAEGQDFPSTARAQFVLAVNNKKPDFEAQGQRYTVESVSDELHVVSNLTQVAQAINIMKQYDITPAEGMSLPSDFNDAFVGAIQEKADQFAAGGQTYQLVLDRKVYYAYKSERLALATYNIMDLVFTNESVSFEFRYQAEKAASQGQDTTFSADGQNYVLKVADDTAEIYRDSGSEQAMVAVLSRYVVSPLYSDVVVTIEFKDAVKQAIADGLTTFNFAQGNEAQRQYTIERDNTQWIIRTVEDTLVIRAYDFPSQEHWLGTDANGMDILTRLMYGGRISLMIGFIVVLIETFIGVILGGIAGYFGKWIDNLLMRIVDIFNSIPSIPIIIIIGAVMDGMRIDPQIRMVYLMLILGVLGWPGIARLVRGQILSLREQEFMVAAEATGLSVYRRIFKHLVPNVIPQLIVISTMSLGGIILTESTLSFLGLGVKFPFASWGNIINAVSNVHVMTNYWFVWIPAGFCILITVLGFNFIGDGLRDAFDPKMKR
ncbi:MAG: ABC transporter permease [Clostridiales bacterium]|nr:ABC transporter permease [Clostridiales bacterium]